MTDAVTNARDIERAFTDICDELGCAYDNEAALEAIASLKARTLSPAPVERREATALDGETIVGLLWKHFNERAYSDLTFKRWKDGIDIDYPTFAVEQFVASIVALPCPDEAAIRADEREKCLNSICSCLLVLSNGFKEQGEDETAIALSNAAVFTCGRDRTAAIRNKGDAL